MIDGGAPGRPGLAPMRILICSNAYPPHFIGGAELMAHEQAKALARLGHEVRVFAGELGTNRARHARADDVHEGIPVHRFALNPEDYSPEFLNFLHPTIDNHFSDILDDFQPHIVHCHNLMGLSAKLPLLGRLHGAWTVCTLHDFWGFCLRNTAVRPNGETCNDTTQCRICLPRIHDGSQLHISMRLRKDFLDLALDQIDCFVAPSRFVAKRYARAGWSPERLHVITNGIDLDMFSPAGETSSPPSPVRITYAGYFGAHKGIATLLEAFASLPPALDPTVLQLAGEGPEQDAYVNQIEMLGLHGRVQFLGKVAPSDMPMLYAQSDIVVLPSIWDENQPVCLMEAMAAGLPVIASRKGGIPELVKDGVNGLLFPAGDATGLAAQLSKLVAKSGLRQRLGDEARRRVVNSSHDHQARLLLALYKEMMGAAPDRLPRDLVHTRQLYAAIGSLRPRMTGENISLDDKRHRSRHFVPPGWIRERSAMIKGVLLTGRLWCMLHLLRIDPILPLPRRSTKLLRHKAKRPPT